LTMRQEREKISDKVVGRELMLGDLLDAGDVTPLLKALVAAEASIAAITDDKGEILWIDCADADIGAARVSVADYVTHGKTAGKCLKSAPLMHEGEVIGNLFICLSGLSGTSQFESVVPTIDAVSAALASLVRANSRRIMTTEIHGEVVNRSFEELMESNRRISASEKKYRELSETLQARVDEKTEELKKAFTRMLKQEKLSSIGRLAAGMAHEINNPAGFISSNLNTFSKYVGNLGKMICYYRSLPACASPDTEALYEKLKIGFILKDTADLIGQSAQGVHRIKEIVSNLKDFAHVDDSRHIAVDLPSELDKALNVLSHRIAEKSVNVVRAYSDVPKIVADPADISLAFLNILINALESREEGLEISLSTGLSGNNVVVTITDNGCGMPEEVSSRIFEPFFTTRDVGRGVGLGLTVSYEIISAIGGDIEVSSEDGRGTTLSLSFPSGQDFK